MVKKYLKVGAGLVLLLLLIGLVWLLRLINSPATGKGISVASSNIKPAVSQPAPNLKLAGKHFSFAYPAGFSPEPINPPKPPFIENYLLIKKQQPGSWQLTVEIESLPSGNLNDDGSYHLRKAKPDVYTEKMLTVGAIQVHEMTDTTAGSPSTTAFFTQAGLMAAVSLTGGSSSDAAATQTVLTTVLSSWRWL